MAIRWPLRLWNNFSIINACEFVRNFYILELKISLQASLRNPSLVIYIIDADANWQYRLKREVYLQLSCSMIFRVFFIISAICSHHLSISFDRLISYFMSHKLRFLLDRLRHKNENFWDHKLKIELIEK